MCLLWRHFEKVIYMEMGTAINENRDHNGEASVSSFHRSEKKFRTKHLQIYNLSIPSWQHGLGPFGSNDKHQKLKSGQNNKLFVNG